MQPLTPQKVVITTCGLSAATMAELANAALDLLVIRPISLFEPGQEGTQYLVFVSNGEEGTWTTGQIRDGELWGSWMLDTILEGFEPTHFTVMPAAPVDNITVF